MTILHVASMQCSAIEFKCVVYGHAQLQVLGIVLQVIITIYGLKIGLPLQVSKLWQLIKPDNEQVHGECPQSTVLPSLDLLLTYLLRIYSRVTTLHACSASYEGTDLPLLLNQSAI